MYGTLPFNTVALPALSRSVSFENRVIFVHGITLTKFSLRMEKTVFVKYGKFISNQVICHEVVTLQLDMCAEDTQRIRTSKNIIMLYSAVKLFFLRQIKLKFPMCTVRTFKLPKKMLKS